MSGYIGNIPVPQATQTRDNFTATDGQTTFSTSGYTPSYLDVYLNGIHLDPSDYTATNGTDVVLSSGASAGDVVTVVAYQAFEVADQAFSGDFSVDGSTFVVDSANDRIGIGTSSPLRTLHVSSAGDTGLMLQTTNAVNDKEIWEIQVAGNASNYADLIFRTRTNAGTGGTERMRIDASGNVGIGTTSPSENLEIASSFPTIKLKDSDNNYYSRIRSGNGSIYIEADESNGAGSTFIAFRLDATERMRIDSSGNLLVGKTVNNNTTSGIRFLPSGFMSISRSGDACAIFNRASSDGVIAYFNKDGTTVGSIGSLSDYIYFIGASNGIRIVGSRVYPCTSTGSTADNVMDLGFTSARYDDIYATNGTIQTSDRNEKQDIEELSEAEQRVAVACKGLMRKFRWKDAVAEKGDDARIHFGIIAQDLQDAFAAEGLDAGKYAMFISSTWWETQTEVPAVEAVEAQDAVYDDEGNLVSEAVEAVEAKEAYIRTDTYETAEEAPEGATERTRLGVRYPELLAFIIAAI